MSLYSEKINTEKQVEKYNVLCDTDIEKLLTDAVLGMEFERYIVDEYIVDDIGDYYLDLINYANNKIESLGYETYSLSAEEANKITDTYRRFSACKD